MYFSSEEKCLFYKTNRLENNNDNIRRCFIFILLYSTTSKFIHMTKKVVSILPLINDNEAKCMVSRINYVAANSVWAVTWISIGNELNLIGQMNVIRVARAYITSRFESIQIPEQKTWMRNHFHLWLDPLLSIYGKREKYFEKDSKIPNIGFM